MEAIRFVTDQTQVLQVHHNSAKFAYKYGPKIYMDFKHSYIGAFF